MDATPEGLESLLAEDLAWRKIELSVLSKSLESAANRNPDSPESRALSRATVTLSYAHWEGYTKNALDGYCRFLSRRRLRLAELNDSLLTAQAVRLIKRQGSGDKSVEKILVELLRGRSTKRLTLPRTEMSDTRSNLRHERLQELLEGLGLAFDPFVLVQNLIDVRLCDRRNSVAHGRSDSPDSRDTLDLKNQAVELMESVRGMLIRAVSEKTYYAANNPKSSA